MRPLGQVSIFFLNLHYRSIMFLLRVKCVTLADLNPRSCRCGRGGGFATGRTRTRGCPSDVVYCVFAAPCMPCADVHQPRPSLRWGRRGSRGLWIWPRASGQELYWPFGTATSPPPSPASLASPSASAPFPSVFLPPAPHIPPGDLQTEKMKMQP